MKRIPSAGTVSIVACSSTLWCLSFLHIMLRGTFLGNIRPCELRTTARISLTGRSWSSAYSPNESIPSEIQKSNLKCSCSSSSEKTAQTTHISTCTADMHTQQGSRARMRTHAAWAAPARGCVAIFLHVFQSIQFVRLRSNNSPVLGQGSCPNVGFLVRGRSSKFSRLTVRFFAGAGAGRLYWH